VVLDVTDILISSTRATQTVVGRELVTEVMARRPQRPLLIVDIAVPRDVDPGVADIEGVFLKDIDDLKSVVAAGLGSRLAEIGKVESIIDTELARFIEWERSSEVDPSIAALLARAEELRSGEVEKLLGRVPTVSERDRAAIDRATRRIVSKLLHDPIEKTRRLSASKQGHIYAAALRELFGLDDEPEA
jgi:glutamyl-tRNA reductase